MDERPPRILRGARKVYFDTPDWETEAKPPRYRLVYRNEPTDGAVDCALVLAIDRRERMIAYAKASGRLRKRISEEGLA